MFKFSPANTKLKKLNKVVELENYNSVSGKKVYSFDLLSGYTCPGANECLSRVVEINGSRKIKDGPNTQFRCFSASQEALLTNVYNLRKHNTTLMRSLSSTKQITKMLVDSLPKNAGIVRFHVSGDIFKAAQFLSYCKLAELNQNTLFYGYTKSLPIFIKYRDKMPSNFRMLASRGGKYDDLIDEYDLPFSRVVFSIKEAEDLGLPIDDDDSHAALGISCALLAHGTMPKGSDAAKAISLLRKLNKN